MSNKPRSAPDSVPTLALVEDDATLRDELSFQLQHHGWRVLPFPDALGFYRHMAVAAVDAVILDIGLPGESGLDVARLLRSHDAQLPVVILTAHTDRAEKLSGLSAGVDAYLNKPVDLEELRLVLRRLLDRQASLGTQPVPPSAASVDAVAPSERWKLNNERAMLITPDGGRVKLTLVEMRLLATLAAHQGRPCKPVDLARGMGLQADEWDRHRLEVIISRLRGKVERESGLEAPIRTVRGLGYAWNADETPDGA